MSKRDIDGRFASEIRLPTTHELAARIAGRIEVTPSGCWLWQGSKGPKGYGQIAGGVRNRKLYTHRVMFEAHKGPIPTGLQIDHLCRVTGCCNPDHLEAVSPRENTVRGNSPRLARERGGKKTHCPRGHAYTPDNTYVSAAGYKSCRECRARQHEIWARKRRS